MHNCSFYPYIRGGNDDQTMNRHFNSYK